VGSNAIITVSGSQPATPVDGTLWLDNETGELGVYLSPGWVTIGAGVQGPIGYTGSVGAGYTGSASTEVGYTGSAASLPSQTGNSGKYLTTDGSTASWGTVSIPANSTLTNPTFTNYTETRYTATITSNAITLDLTNGTFQSITTMVGSNAITLPAVGAGKSLTVQILYASTPTTMTFATPSGTLKWPGGTTPTPTLTNTKIDFYAFVSDGTNWYGTQSGANF
jgi:hypothetical protein